ncbi:unnamed protein product [Clavelina lepadiformis]|uniref:Fibrinogen C-terminal domain-containing protein n=1 Tax=Clavelina lepadiformis TaxID=159417 RepID=A0ABP0FRF1_CLALP
MKRIVAKCTSIYASGSTSSGIYTIWLKERFQFIYVYCNMDLVSIKKGWTTIQKRMNGEVNFNRGWDDYVRGFGNPRGEYWLGLENIYRVYRQTTIFTGDFHEFKPLEVGFHLEDWDGVKAFAEYKFFLYSSKKSNYDLVVFRPAIISSCFSDVPIEISQFSTPDVDNNKYDSHHCGQEFKSGWWWYYGSCETSNLNQPYPKYKQDMTRYNMYWEGWSCFSGTDTALRFVSMNLYQNYVENN